MCIPSKVKWTERVSAGSGFSSLRRCLTCVFFLVLNVKCTVSATLAHTEYVMYRRYVNNQLLGRAFRVTKSCVYIVPSVGNDVQVTGRDVWSLKDDDDDDEDYHKIR